MNQILSIDGNGKEKRKKMKEPKMRNSGPIEIKTVVRFFAIAMLIFGVFMIGTGSYSMYKDAQEEAAKIKPTINISKETADSKQLTLKVSHNKSLEQVTYSWNDEQPTQIQTEGRKTIEQVIDIPAGENKLTVYAKDKNGLESKYEGQYQTEGGIQINIEVQNPKIKITASGQDELSFMTYRWDEEEETKVDINDVKIEQEIEVPEGNHTLTVIVVDVNNKTETQVQEVSGVRNQGNEEEGNAQIEVLPDDRTLPENFIIKAQDESGIKRVEFIRNETDKNAIDYDRVHPSAEDRKTFEFKYPLQDGENRLEVKVYTEDGLVTTKKVKLTKPTN